MRSIRAGAVALGARTHRGSLPRGAACRPAAVRTLRGAAAHASLGGRLCGGPAAACSSGVWRPLAAQQRGGSHRCAATSEPAAPAPLVAVEGDIVTLHFVARDPDGQVIESTRAADEPLSFEIGAGEVMGNPIFKAFDGAVRGLGVGEVVEVEMSGGDWQPELLFTVPRSHPEVEQLEGRYKNVGGLAEGLVIELSNGSTAVVLEVGEEAIKLDANNVSAGKTLVFQLEVLGIERAE
ncbi:hypothetical protein Rsub_03237 [Raphidocelis subcapitata]|uniref:peptidylprolyl isomerase n=1 Tax=Raphidocelis subcapitata TaxID=307507 RepID=A0A2V0P0Q1_9CHLO|nr:hypothetical protein Rsub_03237 [Raphidocelis subcapitata]|eukprot:GBF90665.1 hypothetical protein Rsub_03237 [Raphidocelis subcapitata]